MMIKKLVAAIVIVLLAILAVTFVAYSNENSPDLEVLTVSSGSYGLNLLIDDVENSSDDSYDNETLEWMKSLGDKTVFTGDGIIVIMNSYDAEKLNQDFVTDVDIEQYFECRIIENHSLGNTEYPKDVLLVDRVTKLGENITYFEV